MTRLLSFVLRLLLGGAFVFAATLKIFDPASFANDIAHYRLVPHLWINFIAITLPWVELTAGLALIFGFWRRASALVLLALTVVFLIAISQAIARGLDIRCGCFGTIGAGQIGWRNLAIDGALMAMAAWLVWREKNERLGGACEKDGSIVAP